MKKLLLFLYRFLQFLRPSKRQILSTPLLTKTSTEVSTASPTTVYRIAAQNFETETAVKSISFSDIITNSAIPQPTPTLSRTSVKSQISYTVNGSVEEKPIIQVKQITREEAFKLSNLRYTIQEIGQCSNLSQAKITNILKKGK